MLGLQWIVRVEERKHIKIMQHIQIFAHADDFRLYASDDDLFGQLTRSVGLPAIDAADIVAQIRMNGAALVIGHGECKIKNFAEVINGKIFSDPLIMLFDELFGDADVDAADKNHVRIGRHKHLLDRFQQLNGFIRQTAIQIVKKEDDRFAVVLLAHGLNQP